jgi:hypothetical protein
MAFANQFHQLQQNRASPVFVIDLASKVRIYNQFLDTIHGGLHNLDGSGLAGHGQRLQQDF